LACAELIVTEMNDLAARFAANKPKIEKLRRMLALVRGPV
jgi:hypothetical protein